MTSSAIAAWASLAAAVLALLAVDLKVFARGREPTLREGALWSLGWLALSLLAALVVWALAGPQDAGLYTTVYLIERVLSLDNLFVFLLLFAYFGIPAERRPRLLFAGIVAALVLRAGAIGAGSALIEQFHFVLYVLGATLLVLAWKVFGGVGQDSDPGRSLAVRAVRRVVPGASAAVLCVTAIVMADIAFAVDSIPAAFAITRDAFLIWMGNAFALLGLRALFVLVEGLVARFRYLHQTIALVLGLVGVKLLLEDVVPVGPAVSLAAVVALLAGGVAASLLAERRPWRGWERMRES